MVITKTVMDDNVMRMKSQPQLATRWLWSFASFVLKKHLPLFWIHWTSFVLNSFCFICFEPSRLITVLHFICSNEIYMLAFESFFWKGNIWMSGMVRKIITWFFSFLFLLQKMLKSSFDQTRFCHSGWWRLKFVFSRSFFLRVFCLGPVWLVCFLFWRSVSFFEKFAFSWSRDVLQDFCLYMRGQNVSFSAKRFVCSHFSFGGKEILILDLFAFSFRLGGFSS